MDDYILLLCLGKWMRVDASKSDIETDEKTLLFSL